MAPSALHSPPPRPPPGVPALVEPAGPATARPRSDSASTASDQRARCSRGQRAAAARGPSEEPVSFLDIVEARRAAREALMADCGRGVPMIHYLPEAPPVCAAGAPFRVVASAVLGASRLATVAAASRARRSHAQPEGRTRRPTRPRRRGRRAASNDATGGVGAGRTASARVGDGGTRVDARRAGRLGPSADRGGEWRPLGLTLASTLGGCVVVDGRACRRDGIPNGAREPEAGDPRRVDAHADGNAVVGPFGAACLRLECFVECPKAKGRAGVGVVPRALLRALRDAALEAVDWRTGDGGKHAPTTGPGRPGRHALNAAAHTTLRAHIDRVLEALPAVELQCERGGPSREFSLPGDFTAAPESGVLAHLLPVGEPVTCEPLAGYVLLINLATTPEDAVGVYDDARERYGARSAGGPDEPAPGTPPDGSGAGGYVWPDTFYEKARRPTGYGAESWGRARVDVYGRDCPSYGRGEKRLRRTDQAALSEKRLRRIDPAALSDLNLLYHAWGRVEQPPLARGRARVAPRHSAGGRHGHVLGPHRWQQVLGRVREERLRQVHAQDLSGVDTLPRRTRGKGPAARSSVAQARALARMRRTRPGAVPGPTQVPPAMHLPVVRSELAEHAAHRLPCGRPRGLGRAHQGRHEEARPRFSGPRSHSPRRRRTRGRASDACRDLPASTPPSPSVGSLEASFCAQKVRAPLELPEDVRRGRPRRPRRAGSLESSVGARMVRATPGVPAGRGGREPEVGDASEKQPLWVHAPGRGPGCLVRPWSEKADSSAVEAWERRPTGHPPGGWYATECRRTRATRHPPVPESVRLRAWAPGIDLGTHRPGG